MEINLENYLKELAALKPAFIAKRNESLFVAWVRSLVLIFPQHADKITAAAGYEAPATKVKQSRTPMTQAVRLAPKQVRATRKLDAGCPTCGDNAVKVVEKKPLQKSAKVPAVVPAVVEPTPEEEIKALDEIGDLLAKAGIKPEPKKLKYGFEKLTDAELNSKMAELQAGFDANEKVIQGTEKEDPNYNGLIEQSEAIYQELNAAKEEIKARAKKAPKE